MFCKYCGKNSGTSNICSECNEKINNTMQNCSVGENINSNQEYDRYKEQRKTYKIADGHIEYKGFWTFPRIMGIVAAILFAICCIEPIYICGDDVYVSLIDIPKGGSLLLIPLFMLLNAIFDKSITTVSLSGIHSGFLRFKLCIFWGTIGLCAIIITPCMLSYIIGIVVQGYIGTFYIAVISCVLQIIAPFLVKENDGTGIKPVKKYDFIWIVPLVVITLFLCCRVYNVNYNGYNDYVDTYADDDSYINDNTNVNNTYNSEVKPQTNPVYNKRDAYISKMEEIVRGSGGNKYCVYDIDNDGTDDFIIFYRGYAGWNNYEAYVYEGDDFINAGVFEGVAGEDTCIYKSRYIGFYVYSEDLSGDSFKYIYSKYKYNNGIVSLDSNDYVEETIYGDYIVDGDYVDYNAFSQNVNIILENYLPFSDNNDYSAIESANFNN